MKNTYNPPKMILTHHYTKRDLYGNVYHAVTIESLRTGKAFTVRAPSLSNVTHVLFDAFGGWENCRFVLRDQPTGSARFSSLPDGLGNLNPCSFEDGKSYSGSWKRELNKIGFRLPSNPAKP